MAARFLGIDCGTSGMRACAIAAGGEVDEFASVEFGHLAEHEMAAAWRDALLDLLAGLPVGLRKRLAAVAVDATSATLLSCDEALSPTAPPIPYHDARARTEAAEIGRAAGRDHPAASPSSGLAKVMWLNRRLPAGRRHLFLNQADWLTALLSELPGISDYHNALKLGYDPSGTHWPEWVAYLTDVDCLPNVVPPGSPLGPIARPRAVDLGIAGDCLIRSGTTDSIAAFIAAGLSRPGEAVTSLGTTLVLKLLSASRVEDGRSGVYSHWYGRLWLAGGASNAGGGVLRHYFDAAELAALSAQIDPATESGLDYYPLVDPGERFPINDPDLPPRLAPRPAERVRFLQGMLEGLARIEAMGYRRLAELGATPVRRILATGGGSGNPAYAGLRQRQLGLAVERAEHADAAYGAALLARHGTCLFPGACDE